MLLIKVNAKAHLAEGEFFIICRNYVHCTRLYKYTNILK